MPRKLELPAAWRLGESGAPSGGAAPRAPPSPRARPDFRACARPSAPPLAPWPRGLVPGMVLSELAARLNCAEYKNWVKAGHCLLLLRGCLQGFVGREVLAFHRSLLAAAPGLGPLATCRSGSRCSPRARQVSTRPGVLTVAPHPVRGRSASCPPRSRADRRAWGSDAQTPPLPPGPLLTAAPCSFSLSVRCAQSGNGRF